MKNTENVKRYYAMSLIDGRILLVTRELLTNPDYRVVTEQLAQEVESGARNWRQVAIELRRRDSMKPDELVKRAEQEKVKNMRRSVVTRENVEQFETKISEDELGEVFGGEGAPEEPQKKAEAASAKTGGETVQKPRDGKPKGRKPSTETPAPLGTLPPAGEAEELDL